MNYTNVILFAILGIGIAILFTEFAFAEVVCPEGTTRNPAIGGCYYPDGTNVMDKITKKSDDDYPKTEIIITKRDYEILNEFILSGIPKFEIQNMTGKAMENKLNDPIISVQNRNNYHFGMIIQDSRIKAGEIFQSITGGVTDNEFGKNFQRQIDYSVWHERVKVTAKSSDLFQH
jgi:hypothetical protein